MKKIAILIPQFYWGGMPQVASKLIKLLQNRYRITLILVNSNLDVRVDYFNALLINLNGNQIQKIIQLHRIFNQNKFEAIISFGLVDNLLNIVLNIFNKSRVIITEHSSKSYENYIEQNKLKRYLFKLIIKYIYPHANSIVAVSEGIKADLANNFNLRNIKVIYNPSTNINANDFSLSEQDLLLINNIKDSNGKILLNAGRITRAKGQLSLVKSMQYLHNNEHLILLGEGPDDKVIRDAVSSLHLDNIVHIIGYRNNISNWMEIADAYVSLSWFEGFPTTFIEAVEANTPIISADIFSGPREILSNGLLKDYTKKLSYPCTLVNGVLTERFDFRKESINFSAIEKEFAATIKEFFIKFPWNNNLDSLTLINNSEIRQQYIDLIEG